jgi:hypothetical protein
LSPPVLTGPSRAISIMAIELKGKVRPIINLSKPKGFSFNDNVDKESAKSKDVVCQAIQSVISVAKGPKVRPQTSKRAAKSCEGPEILAAEFLLDLQKRAEKGPNFFKTLGSRGNLGIFRDEHIFNPTHILFHFFSFQHIISSRQ